MKIFSRRFVYRDLWTIHNLRWLVVARFFAHTIFYSSVMVLFEQQRGLNFTEIFLLEAILSACLWLFNVPTGIWADQFGERSLLIVGYGLLAVGSVIFAFAHALWVFVCCEILSGIGMACISGCESALVYRSLPEKTAGESGTSAFALLNSASSMGFFFGLTVGSFMAAYGPAFPVYVAILPAALGWLATWLLRPVKRQGTEGTHEERVGMGDLLRLAWYEIRRQPILTGFSFFDAAAFALVNAIFWYNQPYFLHAGIAVVWFGLLTAGAQATGLLATLITPLMRRHLGMGFTLTLACLLPGVAYIMLSVVHVPIFTVLLVAVIVACPAWRQPIVNDELNKRITNGARATTLSALSLIGAATGIVLNLLVGSLGDRGLDVVSVGMGAGLIVLCILIPVLTVQAKQFNRP
jgi:MFS family permease